MSNKECRKFFGPNWSVFVVLLWFLMIHIKQPSAREILPQLTPINYPTEHWEHYLVCVHIWYSTVHLVCTMHPRVNSSNVCLLSDHISGNETNIHLQKKRKVSAVRFCLISLRMQNKCECEYPVLTRFVWNRSLKVTWGGAYVIGFFENRITSTK